MRTVAPVSALFNIMLSSKTHNHSILSLEGDCSVIAQHDTEIACL